MNVELAQTYLAAFAPDRPAPTTVHEASEVGSRRRNPPRINAENMQRLAVGSTACPSAPAARPRPRPRFRLHCDACQSSPFETSANKAATYIPSAIRSHKLRHHNDEQEFLTWLMFNQIDPKPGKSKCPLCRSKCYTSKYRLQQHLLEQHHGDVPKKLPGEIFSLAYRSCMNHWRLDSWQIASKYTDMVMQLERNSAAAPKRKAFAEIREHGGKGTGTRNQGNKKASKVGDMGYLRSVYEAWQRSL